MSSLIFEGPEGSVCFPSSVLASLRAHRQHHAWSREAGGQLFSPTVGARLTIERITPPGEKDVRSRYSFWPRRDAEQRDIHRMFKAGLHYIGDWHTHPEDRPRPSRADVEKIGAIFRQSRHQLHAMLLVIVGRTLHADGIFVAHVNLRGVFPCEVRTCPDSAEPPCISEHP
jgi:integrative and conjugative element protein (TIGR02256 family)